MQFEFVRCGACGAGVKLDAPTEDDPFLPCPYCAHLMEPAEAPPFWLANTPPPVDPAPAPDTRTPEQKMNDARDAMFRNIFGEGDEWS